MRYRMCTVAAAIGLNVLVLVPISAQAPLSSTAALKAAAPAAVRSLKTPWGAPDLQGVWSNAMITPLERPRDLGTKEFFTDEEVKARETRAVAEATNEARGRDGKADIAGAYNTFWYDRGTRDVGTRRTSLIISPADGRIPWRADALKQNQERSEIRDKMIDSSNPVGSWLDVDTGERCITDGVPWIPYAYNNNYMIVQSPANIAILHEQFRELRVIPIGDRPRANIPQWFGYSTARWDGGTLVVDTENFADKAAYWWANPWRQARPSYKLTERFSRAAAGVLTYEFTVTDPTLFTSPWTAQVPMTRINEQIFEYACHEHNYAMGNMLGNQSAR